MEIKSPYLEAIQSIAGITSGEKHKTIHTIARQLAGIESAGNDLGDLKNPVPDVPEPLKPLVRVEVAKILHQYEGIIEALKSDDPVVVARAVQAEWFFDGSETVLVNAQYFRENVIPKISMFARLKMIKSFANHLKNTSIAADFFITVADMYSVDQALPLLQACDEEFALNAIIGRKIELPLKQVEVLYRKHPKLIIKYLKHGRPDSDHVRTAYSVDIENYIQFLPKLSVKHFEEFMEIYEEYKGSSEIKLCSKAVSKFLKTRQNLLIENPGRYLKLLPLEKVTRKMSHENFVKMFKNSFPKISSFVYEDVNNLLKYYKPAEDRLPLIFRTLREVYGEDFLDIQNFVNHEMTQVLPVAERIKVARVNLKNDTDWQLDCPYQSWRCYLPTSESIPLITKEIARYSDETVRQQLLSQLMLTCKINDDKDAFLKVLNYFFDRHRNEQSNVFYNCMKEISDSFALETLSSAHWVVLKKLIKMAEVQGDIVNRAYTMMPIIDAGIHYCLLNDLPIDYYLRMFIDIRTELHYTDSLLFEKYPRFEKKLVESVVDQIPKQYSVDDPEVWEDKGVYTIKLVTSLLWDYNNRNRSLNSSMDKLSIENYPWFFDKVKNFIFAVDCKSTRIRDDILKSIKKNEKHLYDAWLLDLPEFWTFGTSVVYEILRKRPQLTLDNWKECLAESLPDFCKDRMFIRFIKKIRWYQDLPINIFNECLETYKDSEKTTCSMFILACLSDGETYSKIIEPRIPANEKLDIEESEARENLEILRAVTQMIPKVNPPVPLDTIARFCIGDYLQMVIGSIFGVSSRVPVNDVMPFIKTLINRPVSVKKHGIRLICSIAPSEEILDVLTDLWKTEQHPSIRNVIFNEVYNYFHKQPDSRSWCLLRMCLDNLNENDDPHIFQSLQQLSKVPDEYIYEYVKTVLNKFKFVQDQSENPKQFIKFSCDLIRNIDRLITDNLPEEYCQELIKEYLFVLDADESIVDVGKNLALDSYLLVPGNHFESRYKFFGNFFRDTVRKDWGKCHKRGVHQYPMNLMVNDFFNSLISKTYERKYDTQIFETFLEIFNSVLEPQQDASSYLGLVYSICFHSSDNLKVFGKTMVKKIPELIETFSPEFAIFISEELFSFLQQRSGDILRTSEEEILDVIEIFTYSGVDHCSFIAANMLLQTKLKVNNEQYNNMVNTLRNSYLPGVRALISKHLITGVA